MIRQTVIAVNEISQVGEARRVTVRLAAEAQFDEVAQGRLAIIATELATNLIRHATRGYLLLQLLQTADGPTVELISLDSSPGIANVGQALADGFSTAGTAGNGLGAIKRLSDEFDIYSQVGRGTVIISRVFHHGLSNSATSGVVWGAICIPATYETECGDCWRLLESADGCSLLVVDGLGHGPLAAEAAEIAAAAFVDTAPINPATYLQAAHKALAGSRGAAVAMARVNFGDRSLRFAGIGNISGTLVSNGDRRGLCSHNGIVGHQVRKFQEFDFSWSDQALLIMHSDGLQGRWGLDDYPGLQQRHPATIAGILYRDFVRGRDDATVVVARLDPSKAR